jgi:hypothetical protein
MTLARCFLWTSTYKLQINSTTFRPKHSQNIWNVSWNFKINEVMTLVTLHTLFLWLSRQKPFFFDQDTHEMLTDFQRSKSWNFKINEVTICQTIDMNVHHTKNFTTSMVHRWLSRHIFSQNRWIRFYKQLVVSNMFDIVSPTWHPTILI